jgi:uncharacterized protein (TIGR03435 family)
VYRITVIAIFVSAVAAQPPARRSFEVATIKKSPDCRSARRRPSPGRLDFACVSLREVLVNAYGALQGDPMPNVAMDVLGGPSWIDSERYDLLAKAEDRPSVNEMLGPMLIGLLEDRFHLKAHIEPRETSVFALRLVEGSQSFALGTAKDSQSLQPAAEGSCQLINLEALPQAGDRTHYCGYGRWRNEGGTEIGDLYGNTMADLARRVLPIEVGLRVVDQTGLSGRFDIHLEFRRTIPVRVNGVEVANGAGESTARTVFTALQRLGLKLISTKAPVDVVVIDSIERPSEN